MAAPTRIYDISTTAASNSPTGSESVGTSLDDYLRAIQTVYRLDLASKGADIASAGTTDLGAIGGLMHDITGTTTITSFGTVAAGIPKIIKFEGALTLTHNSTSLILPGGANITTADGDIAWMISEGSGNWRCVSYFRAAVVPLAATPALEKLDSGTVSDDATLDIVLTSHTNYVNKIVVLNLIPSTDGVGFYMRFSTDGGSNYDSGASDYGTEVVVADGSTSENNSVIRLTSGGLVGNAATEGVSFTVTLYDTVSTAKWQRVSWEGVYVDSAATPVIRAPHGAAARRTAQNTDAIRFLFSSGNIASGTWTLYGFN